MCDDCPIVRAPPPLDPHTHTHTDRQTDTHTHTHTDRQTDRRTGEPSVSSLRGRQGHALRGPAGHAICLGIPPTSRESAPALDERRR